MTVELRELAASPVGHSRHFTPGDFGHDSQVMAQRVLCGFATRAAGSGWFSTRRTETGTRIWKIAEPANPPKHFIHGRDAAGDNLAACAG